MAEPLAEEGFARKNLSVSSTSGEGILLNMPSIGLLFEE
jgi:hypothetical protein